MARSMRLAIASLLLIAGVSPVVAVKTRAQVSRSQNPIRRVVTMLQSMQKKVTEEAERDEELFKKFLCYCKTGAGDLDKSIGDADTKIPQLESAITEAEQTKTQLETEIKDHKDSAADAKDAIARATAIREKEAATFSKSASDYGSNIAAMAKAIGALEKGMAGFLQTAAASTLRRLVVDMDLSTADRNMLTSFLSADADQDADYAPSSGEITGILKQMQETMEKDLADAKSVEETSVASYESLTAAKSKEVNANQKAIETKIKRLGEVGVEIVNLKEDLADTSKSFAEDKKFLQDLDKNCETKQADYSVIKKERAGELVAIGETIKILNDDDALDLFKKTLPSPSLLQTLVSAKDMKEQAFQFLQTASGKHDTRLNLISLALRGKKADFGKVVTMIDKMATLLKQEQADDEAKKSYCEETLDKAEDSKKAIDQDAVDLGKALEDGKGVISALEDDLDALAKSIKETDAAVQDATATRKAEHSAYSDTMASDGAAKEILGVAKNRLNKYYNPKLYKAPDPVLAQDSADPGPAPDAPKAFKKKEEESNGVLSMLDMLVADLEKEMQTMKVEETHSQSEYEEFMTDAKLKRAMNSKSIMDKEGNKADLEANLEKDTLALKTKKKNSYTTAVYIRDLHGECDWLIKNFDTRREARTGEIEALSGAKAVLSGADYA